MIVKCLLENTTNKNNIISEHGLSLYIETKSHNILFDMGQSDAFSKNAETMGVDLTTVDVAVLSHGHYDHGGGLMTFLNINKKAKVYINKYAFEEHFNGTEKYIGLNKELLNYKDRFIFTDEDLIIDDELTVLPCKNRIKLYPVKPYGLNVLENGELQPEDFRHEHCLQIVENGKKVLISGCSHNGIINIVDWYKPDYLIGGFHLMKIDPESNKEELYEYADKLSKYKTIYYTCHCTGVEQYNVLKNRFNGNLNYISAGDIITI